MTEEEEIEAMFAAAGFPEQDDQENIQADEGSDLTNLRMVCTDTIEAYIAEIAEMTVTLAE